MSRVGKPRKRSKKAELPSGYGPSSPELPRRPNGSSHGGTPTLYSQELADRLLAEIAGGLTMRKACDKVGLNYNTAIAWAWKNESFRTQHRAALEVRALAQGEEVVDFVDEQAGSVADATGAKVLDIKMRSRMWMAERLNPSVFGQRQKIEMGGRLGVSLTDQQLDEQIEQLRAQIAAFSSAPAVT